MKKLSVLILLMTLSVYGFSQSDSLRTSKKKIAADTGWYKAYPNEQMIKIKPSEAPSSLRTTLMQSSYKGWEAGTLYRNKKTNEYALQLPPTTARAVNSKTAGWFRFDAQGAPLPDPGAKP